MSILISLSFNAFSLVYILMKLIGDVDKLRKLSELTIKSLAKSASTSEGSLSNFFKGKSDLGASKFIRVLEDLEVPVQSYVEKKLREKTGLIDFDSNDLQNDFLILYEKLNDINKKIVLTSLLKQFSNPKEKDINESFNRIKKRVSTL